MSLGKPQTRSCLVVWPLNGGGVKTWPLRKKTLFEARKKSEKNVVATMLEGGG